MLTIHTQFVTGPVQTAKHDVRRLFFPNIGRLASATPSLDRMRSLITSKATLEDVALAGFTVSGGGLLDGDVSSKLPKLSKVIALLLQREWTDIEARLKDAHDEIKLVSTSIDSIYAMILSHLAQGGGNAVPGAELALQLWKVLWIAHVLQDERELLSKDNFDGTPIDFIGRFWRTGSPSLDFVLPRSAKAAWPVAAHAANRRKPGGESGQSGVSAVRARLAGLTAAYDELAGLCQDFEIVSGSRLLSEVEFLRRNPPAPVDSDRGKSTPGAKPSGGQGSPPAGSAYGNYRALMNDKLLPPGLLAHLSAPTRTLLGEFGLSLETTEPRAVLYQFGDKASRWFGSLNGTYSFYPYTSSLQIGNYIVNIDTGVFADPMCEPPNYPCHCELLFDLDAKHGTKPQVHILGTGRAYRIDQTLARYVRGELVHSEPILRNSSKKMSFRKLDRTVQTDDTTTELETFTETEATTHNQFDLAGEVSKVSQQQQDSSVGATITASYGAAGTSISASGTASSSSSSADDSSDRTAIQNAKETINKAIKRIKERVVTQRILTRLDETERNDSFEIDNKGSPSSTGFYRSINKEYSNQLVCIGKRMVIRFCMQQPMAFLLYCMASQQAEGIVLQKPVAPKDYRGGGLTGLQSSDDITPVNYVLWAAAYGADGVQPPPGDRAITESVALNFTEGMPSWMSGATSIAIPTDYRAVSADVSCVFSGGSDSYIHGHVGSGYYSTSSPGAVSHVIIANGVEAKLAASYRGHVGEYAITFVVNCVPTAGAVAQWKMNTYKAIITAYNQQKDDYDSQVQAAQLQAGVTIAGRNPLKNKMLVEQELQKFVLGAVYPPLYYRGFNSLKFAVACDEKGERKGTSVIPEIDFSDAYGECPWLVFLTQVFEWKNMTYQFQPYSLAQRKDWCTLRNLEDVDQFFENALTAGYVIVDVPVAAQMTEPFTYFLQTGLPWNGGPMPTMGDPLYQDLAIAIRDSENRADGEPRGDPWKTLVPTPLVYVDDAIPADL
ncbi:MAG TPA: hypothetical protein VGO01_19785 [Bradyrhizobium sp.]|nr:hypothetical protein [Bradyrhizobium sp.]